MKRQRRRAVFSTRGTRKKDAPRFVVTGLSRSGTQYTGTVFKSAGIWCGHEKVFGPWSGVLHLRDPFAVNPKIRGDSSFMAVPYLDRLRKGDWVFHQVREPIAVVRSHMGMRFFADRFVPSKDLAGSHRYYLAIIKEFLPDLFDAPDEITRCVRYWIEWNEAIEESAGKLGLNYLRYRIEDFDLALFKRLNRLLGAPVGQQALAKALRVVSHTTNTRTRSKPVSWEALSTLPNDLRRRFTTLASRYGYPTS